MTDDELDERVTALEENGGSGDTQNSRVFILWLLCFVSNIETIIYDLQGKFHISLVYHNPLIYFLHAIYKL